MSPTGFSLVLLCAGKGMRMRGVVADKALAPLLDAPVALHSLRTCAAVEGLKTVVLVHRDDAQRQVLEDAINAAGLQLPRLLWAPGGGERQDSVACGLAELEDPDQVVLIHDSARPLITPELIRRLVGAAARGGAAVAAHRVADTVRACIDPSAGQGPVPLHDLDRSHLWAMETPQAFRLGLIRDSLAQVRAEGIAVTDDVAAVTRSGFLVTLVENPDANLKITRPEDLAAAAAILQLRAPR